jgi:hypothetical protein
LVTSNTSKLSYLATPLNLVTALQTPIGRQSYVVG